MNCNFCGNFVADGASECPICGKRVLNESEIEHLSSIPNVPASASAPTMQIPMSQSTVGSSSSARRTSGKKKKKANTSLVAPIVLLVLAAGGFYLGFRDTTQNMLDNLRSALITAFEAIGIDYQALGMNFEYVNYGFAFLIFLLAIVGFILLFTRIANRSK